MLRPKLDPLTSPRRPAGSPRAIAEWIFLLAVVAVLAGTTWGRLRTTGPPALAAGSLALWAIGWSDRRATARRLVVLLVTVAVATLLRNYTDGGLAHRGGRFALLAGLGLTALLSLPAAFVAALSRVSAAIAKNPNGRPAALAALGVASAAAAFFASTTDKVWVGDTMPLVPTAVRVWSHGSRELSAYMPGNGYFRWDAYGPGRPYFVRPAPGGDGVYSAYPAGMEAFALPVVAAAGLAGREFDDATILHLEKSTAAVLAGLSLGLFFLLALHVGPPPAALAVTALLATGSVFTTTLGMLLWQHGGVVFWSLLAILAEFRSGGRPGRIGSVIQGVACGMMLACRPSAVTFLVPFGLWVFARDWRRGLVVPAVAALAFLPWAWVNWSVYRSPFGPTMGVLGEAWYPGENLWGVLASPGRGLVVYQPWLAFLLLLPLSRVVPSPAPGWRAFAAVAVGLHLLLIGSWPVWWGGCCYGSRLVAEVVPLLALFAVRPVGWVLDKPGGWVVLASVGLLGFALHVPCAYHDAWLWNALPVPVDTHPERLWDWSRPPFLYGLFPTS